MLIDDAGRSSPPSSVQSLSSGSEPSPAQWLSAQRRELLVVGCVALVLAVLVGAQILAADNGFAGPLRSLLGDFVGTPKSASVPWAALALASVGISARRRMIVVGAAVAVDLVFLVARTFADKPFTVGNGPTIALAALTVVAALRWAGKERDRALHAAALGGLLILATKLGDTWLDVTAVSRPRVLDPYVQLADRALGDPSWVMGQVVEALGPAASGLLHWVYIELPVAAIVVAVWQLRGVSAGAWPRHYLVRTFLVLGLIGPIGYLIFPVVGPIFAFGADGHGLQIGDYWPSSVPPLRFSPDAIRFDGFTPRNCMPSMHTAWALAVFIHSRTGPRPLRWGGTFWLVCTLSATLGFGYHYGVDLVAGAVLCLTVESALREPERGFDRYRVRMLAVGAAAMTALLLCYRYLAVQMAEYPVPFGFIVLGALAAVVTTFYGTWFAGAETSLGRWGGRRVQHDVSRRPRASG